MPATLFANKWNMMPPPIIPPPGMEIVVAPVYWPGLKFSISLHISARRHNFYILANYFLGRVLDFPGAAWEGKNHPLKALFSFFFFVLWTVAFAWYARCENKIDVNYAMHTGFTSQTPAFPAFPPAFPSFLGMPVLLLIRFGDLGNSLLWKQGHSILFREQHFASDALKLLVFAPSAKCVAAATTTVCQALINALNHINVAKCFKVSRYAYWVSLERTLGPRQ